MSKPIITAWTIVLGIVSSACLGEALASPGGIPPVVLQMIQSDGPDDGGPPVIPGHEPDAAPAPKGRDFGKAPEAKQPTRTESLDALLGRLAKTKDSDEATGIVALIERLWMQSGSDTADLLMSRAEAAMGNSNHDLARTLLDKIVILRPDWAEAWNKRATLRFLDSDDSGSMEDIGHVLALEPRHFGALSGLGFILKRNGLEKAALTALRRAEQIYPESPDIRKAVEELIPDVEGRDL